MPDLRDLTDLKQQAEELQREVDRAAGEQVAAQKRLQDEFGCSTLAEAERKLRRLRKEETAAKSAFDQNYAAFMREWGKVLEGQDVNG